MLTPLGRPPSSAPVMTTIHSLVDEGLGNSSYLVDIGDGRALAVDPSRDPTAYLDLADANGLTIAYAAETHLHADFVSGSRELSAHGARIVASSLGHRQFSHLGVADGEDVDLGGLTLRALATPGHTPEHLTYLLLDGSRSVALFTGGSLLVGAVARTDLVDPDRGEHYARVLYRSLRDKLRDLPDELRVYPTHGAGSFCSAPAGGERTTTLGRERAANPFLATHDEETFAALLLSGLGSYPPYFLRLQEVNRVGPHVFGESPALPRIGPDAARKLLADGAVIIDVRPVGD
ncbi:MAG: MBL fold metallo-hydrolase, partial [Candidatus Dormibacter sp.]